MSRYTFRISARKPKSRSSNTFATQATSNSRATCSTSHSTSISRARELPGPGFRPRLPERQLFLRSELRESNAGSADGNQNPQRSRCDALWGHPRRTTFYHTVRWSPATPDAHDGPSRSPIAAGRHGIAGARASGVSDIHTRHAHPPIVIFAILLHRRLASNPITAPRPRRTTPPPPSTSFQDQPTDRNAQ